MPPLKTSTTPNWGKGRKALQENDMESRGDSGATLDGGGTATVGLHIQGNVPML
jgi:hypothetical protein